MDTYEEHRAVLSSPAGQERLVAITRAVSRSVVQFASSPAIPAPIRNDSPHDSTAPSAADAHAAEEMRRRIRRSFPGQPLVGEEHKIGVGEPFRAHDLVFIADDIDGSTNQAIFGYGHACVLGAASSPDGRRWSVIAGAITIGPNLHDVTWGHTGRARRWCDGKPVEWRRRQSLTRESPLVVAVGGRNRLDGNERAIQVVRSAARQLGLSESQILFTGMAGNPAIYGLLSGTIDVIFEEKRSKFYDALFLYPLLRERFVVLDDTGRPLGRRELDRYCAEYLPYGRDDRRVIPPYVAARDEETARAFLEAQSQATTSRTRHRRTTTVARRAISRQMAGQQSLI